MRAIQEVMVGSRRLRSGREVELRQRLAGLIVGLGITAALLTGCGAGNEPTFVGVRGTGDIAYWAFGRGFTQAG